MQTFLCQWLPLIALPCTRGAPVAHPCAMARMLRHAANRAFVAGDLVDLRVLGWCSDVRERTGSSGEIPACRPGTAVPRGP